MSHVRPVVSKEADLWILRLRKPNGKVQEYRCTSEGQAKQLALLLNAPVVEVEVEVEVELEQPVPVTAMA